MKTIKYILFIGFYCLFFNTHSYSQSPVFRHYTVDDGLPYFNKNKLKRNEDGFKSSVPASITFEINPPFWKTWWFISLVLTIEFFAIYAYFLSRLKSERKRFLLKEESFINLQKALSAQLNPHFIFNSLNSIQGFIINNDKLASNIFLSKFAKLMRQILENSQQTSISLHEEIETLRIYIELEKLRFAGKFNFNIEVSETVDVHGVNLPPLLFRPYIENAILHGLRYKEGNGNLNIVINHENKQLICTIEDDGIGREKAKEINRNRSNHQSYSMEITKKRIELSKYLHNKEIRVNYHDLKDENNKPLGTKVEIIIHVES